MGNYEDRPLIDYLPNVIKNVREYQALTHTEQPEIFKLFEEIQTALNNEFVLTSTEYGLRRWETILGIIPNPASETIQFRRNRILLRIQTFLPFTERWLKQKIDELFTVGDVVFSVDYNHYKVNAMINQADMNLLNEVKLLFKKVIPANMTWAFEVVEVLLESVLFVGLNLNTRITTREVFDLVPGSYPLRTIVYYGVRSGVTTHIKFRTE